MKLSLNESKVFSHKVGRSEINIDNLDSLVFKKDMLTNEFDICRFKLFGGKKNIFEKLKSIGVPFEIYTINYYNFLPLDKKLKVNIPNEFSTREVLDTKTDSEFLSILNEVLSINDWLEYESLLSKNILTARLRKKLALDYYSSFCPKYKEKTYTGILNKDGKGIGIFMGEFINETFHGAIFGLVKTYRSKGYAQYFYEFMSRECKNRGVKFFVDEVNIFNLPSQKSANNQNLVPKDVYFNVTLFPFFNFKDKMFCNLNLNDFNLSSIILYLETFYHKYKIVDIKTNVFDDFKKSSDYELVKLCPILTQKDLFFVFHVLKDNKIVKSHYIHLNKD